MGRSTPSRFAWDMLVFPLKSCSPSSPRQARRLVSPSPAKPQEAGRQAVAFPGLETHSSTCGDESWRGDLSGGLDLGLGPLRKICIKILLMRTSQATSMHVIKAEKSSRAASKRSWYVPPNTVWLAVGRVVRGCCWDGADRRAGWGEVGSATSGASVQLVQLQVHRASSPEAGQVHP